MTVGGSGALAAQHQPADLVLSGGGVKFIGLVGAIAGLMDGGYSAYRVSGVSAGSVVAVISAAASLGDQLTSGQLKELALSVPLREWRDAGPIPVLGSVLGLVRDTALYRGDFAYDWIRSELKNLGVTTFGDLALDDEELPSERRYKVAVTVADLTAAQLVRLPWDYQRLYGLDPDEQLVADAVRASMAIPFFYPPVQLINNLGLTSNLVDGGVLSNFPLRLVAESDDDASQSRGLPSVFLARTGHVRCGCSWEIRPHKHGDWEGQIDLEDLRACGPRTDGGPALSGTISQLELRRGQSSAEANRSGQNHLVCSL